MSNVDTCDSPALKKATTGFYELYCRWNLIESATALAVHAPPVQHVRLSLHTTANNRATNAIGRSDLPTSDKN